MGNKQLDEAAIFNSARRIDAPEPRARYLKQVCGEDPALLERVDALLRAHDEQESFLESPPPVFGATADTSAVGEGPGTVIARAYKNHRIVVHVLDNGFHWDGQTFKSLTAVAKAVTGSHWNGYHFFGLRKDKGGT